MGNKKSKNMRKSEGINLFNALVGLERKCKKQQIYLEKSNRIKINSTGKFITIYRKAPFTDSHNFLKGNRAHCITFSDPGINLIKSELLSSDSESKVLFALQKREKRAEKDNQNNQGVEHILGS